MTHEELKETESRFNTPGIHVSRIASSSSAWSSTHTALVFNRDIYFNPIRNSDRDFAAWTDTDPALDANHPL